MAIILALACLVGNPLGATTDDTVRSDDETRPQVRRLDGDSEIIERVLRQIRSPRLAPTAIAASAGGRTLLVPAAGNAPGRFGTYFRSDITIANLRHETQPILIVWFPQGDPEGTAAFETPVRTTITFRDFVGSELGLTGVGALLFAPLTADRELDLNGAINVYSRIWSPAADGAPGTFSQAFESVDVRHLGTADSARVIGLRYDHDYRTNYGMVNLSDATLRVRIMALGWGGGLGKVADVTLRPREMILRPLPDVWPHTDVDLHFFLLDDVPEGGLMWTAFGTTTDNVTGDGWVSIGSAPVPR